MPTIELEFKNINTSMQVGDTMYYTPVGTVNGVNTGYSSSIVEIGKIITITTNSDFSSGVICELNDGVNTPSINDFYFFSKDNAVNMSSILGYYGEVEFKNNSKEKAELFSVASGMSESSK